MRRFLLFVLLAAAVFVPLHFANGRLAAPADSSHANVAPTKAPPVERGLTVSPQTSGAAADRDAATSESLQRAAVEQPVRKGIGLRFVDKTTGNGIAGLRIDRPPMAPDAPTTDSVGLVEVAGAAFYHFESPSHGKGRVSVPLGVPGPFELRLSPAFPIAVQIEGTKMMRAQQPFPGMEVVMRREKLDAEQLQAALGRWTPFDLEANRSLLDGDPPKLAEMANEMTSMMLRCGLLKSKPVDETWIDGTLLREVAP